MLKALLTLALCPTQNLCYFWYTGIQNVMTSTSLKTKISRLNNAIEYKWLAVQTTKKLVKLQPLPQMISLPLSTFFSSNTELIYPCFRTVRSSIFYFLKRVLKNVTNQSSIWNWVVSYLFFSFWCIPSFLLTYFEYYSCHSKYYM